MYTQANIWFECWDWARANTFWKLSGTSGAGFQLDPNGLKEWGEETILAFIVIREWAGVRVSLHRSRTCDVQTSYWHQMRKPLGFLISFPRYGVEEGVGEAVMWELSTNIKSGVRVLVQ